MIEPRKHFAEHITIQNLCTKAVLPWLSFPCTLFAGNCYGVQLEQDGKEQFSGDPMAHSKFL